MISSLLRMLYMGVPASVWGQGVNPSEPPRLSWQWCVGRVRDGMPRRLTGEDSSVHLCRWMTYLQTAVFAAANLGFFAQNGLILYFWLCAWNALRHAHLSVGMRPVDLYKICMAIYTAFQITLLVLYAFVQYFTVVLTHTIAVILLSFAAAALFVLLFYRLRQALEPGEGESLITDGSARRAVTGGGYGSASVAGPVPVATIGATPGSYSSQLDEERRRKMSKIQNVAFVCTVGEIFRGCTLIYQASILSGGSSAHFPDTWWVIIFVYYTIAEMTPFGAVLYILRNPPPSSAMYKAGSGAWMTEAAPSSPAEGAAPGSSSTTSSSLTRPASFVVPVEGAASTAATGAYQAMGAGGGLEAGGSSGMPRRGRGVTGSTASLASAASHGGAGSTASSRDGGGGPSSRGRDHGSSDGSADGVDAWTSSARPSAGTVTPTRKGSQGHSRADSGSGGGLRALRGTIAGEVGVGMPLRSLDDSGSGTDELYSSLDIRGEGAASFYEADRQHGYEYATPGGGGGGRRDDGMILHHTVDNDDDDGDDGGFAEVDYDAVARAEREQQAQMLLTPSSRRHQEVRFSDEPGSSRRSSAEEDIGVANVGLGRVAASPSEATGLRTVKESVESDAAFMAPRPAAAASTASPAAPAASGSSGRRDRRRR